MMSHKKKNDMAKKGRPVMSDEELYDKYVKGKEDIIAAACRNGATNEHLQKILGCGKVNFYALRDRIPKLYALLAYNKECADLLVENSIYKRACGYEFEETTTEVVVNKDGAGSTTYVKKTKKHIPADTTAAIYWLKNRKPADWRDKKEVDLTVNPFLELMKSVGEE